MFSLKAQEGGHYSTFTAILFTNEEKKGQKDLTCTTYL